MEKAIMMNSRSAGKPAKALLLLGLSLGYFMVLLDTTVVSVALPAIQSDLGGSLSGLSWVANAYTLVFAALLLSMGAFADKLGAKRVYMGGLILFLVASGLSAAVPTLGSLIAIRALLGIGAAALLPASLALLAHAYPEPAKRSRALGVWAAVTGAAMAAGPIIGGALVDTLGWRSIFLLNIPLAILSLVMTSPLVGETNRNSKRSFDWMGQITATGAMAALIFALIEGDSYGWGNPFIVASFCLAILCLVLFLFIEAKNRSPLLPLRLFRRATVSGGMIAGMAINIGLSGVLFSLPMYFQQIRGLSAFIAGLALLPMMLPLAFNPIFTGRIVGRIGARIPMTVGFGLAAAGTLMQAWTGTNTSYGIPLIGFLLIGFGVSYTIPSLMSAVISSVPKDQTGAVTGALNSSRQLGATLGVTIFGILLRADDSFVGGMHRGLLVAAIILLIGGLVSFLCIDRK